MLPPHFVAFLWRLVLRQPAIPQENNNLTACKTHCFGGIINFATGGIATDRESLYQWIIPSYFPSLSSEVRTNDITASLIGGGSEFQFSTISDKSESRAIHGCAFCESIVFPTFSRSSFSPSGKHPPAKPPAMHPSSTARLVVGCPMRIYIFSVRAVPRSRAVVSSITIDMLAEEWFGGDRFWLIGITVIQNPSMFPLLPRH